MKHTVSHTSDQIRNGEANWQRTHNPDQLSLWALVWGYAQPVVTTQAQAEAAFRAASDQITSPTHEQAEPDHKPDAG